MRSWALSGVVEVAVVDAVVVARVVVVVVALGRAVAVPRVVAVGGGGGGGCYGGHGGGCGGGGGDGGSSGGKAGSKGSGGGCGKGGRGRLRLLWQLRVVADVVAVAVSLSAVVANFAGQRWRAVARAGRVVVTGSGQGGNCNSYGGIGSDC